MKWTPHRKIYFRKLLFQKKTFPHDRTLRLDITLGSGPHSSYVFYNCVKTQMLANLCSVWLEDAFGNWEHKTQISVYLLIVVITLGDREPAYIQHDDVCCFAQTCELSWQVCQPGPDFQNIL